MRHRVLAASLVIAALAGGRAAADIVDRLDQPAADVECAKWWNGAPPRMETLRGKVVILHVSDPERATSKAFAPNLARLAERWKDGPVVLVEVAATASEATVQDYVAQTDVAVTWPVGWDAGGTTTSHYPGSSVPRTYVIGPDGRIAWHAHVGALTREVVELQVSRCAFYDSKSIPEKARGIARAVLDQRFGDAVEAADRVFTDRYAGEDAKQIAVRAKKEISRCWQFQKRMLDGLCEDLDWASAYHMTERMRRIYKGTDHEAEIEAKWEELNAEKKVIYAVELQRQLDQMVEGYGHMGPRDLEKLLTRVTALAENNPGWVIERRCREWIEEIKRRLAKFAPPR